MGLVTPRYAPAIGGVERIVEGLARGLVARGVPVEVITTDPTGDLPAVEERDGVLVRRFPTVRNDSVYFLSPSLGWWLLRNASRFAVLHAHSYHAPLALQAAFASRLSGVPFLLTTCYHGTGHSPLRRVLHLPYRLLGRWMLRQARRVICISGAEQALLTAHFGSGVASVVVPSAVNVEEIVATQARDFAHERTVILGVGRLETYKQVDRLVSAVPELPPDHDVVIIGDGPARSSIQQLVTELGVESRVRLLGHVPQSELLAWYRRADVFASLSRRESYGLAVVEAGVAGAAIVASDIPAHREVVRYLPAGRALLVSPDCGADQLAQALQHAVRRGRAESVDGWPIPSWATNIEASLGCYQAALDSRHVGLARAGAA